MGSDLLAIVSTGLTLEKLVRTLTLQDYNTRVVVIGTMLLGLAAGIVGSYMVLRRRALIGDALSHATLPGIALAFIVMVLLGGTGKTLGWLLLGAVLTGLAGVGIILLIRRTTRIHEDAALGIVLSVSFGLGIALLGIIQKMPTGNQAGLESFIYGKTASMLGRDAYLIAGLALTVVVVCLVLQKEFALISFDNDFAAVQGWPTLTLDLVMMLLVTAVTVIGLQAVGLILIIALLIIPAAAARFWTDRLQPMLALAGTIGAVSGMLGAAISSLLPRLPAGAIIVLVAAALLGVSLLFGASRGVLPRLINYRRLRRSVSRQHLMRALFEWQETTATSMPTTALLAARSWSRPALARLIHRGVRRGELTRDEDGVGLTAAGLDDARRIARNHRLWEIYLITHADIAPSHVDRDADQIEHVLGEAMVAELEAVVVAGRPDVVPPSPHVLEGDTP